MSKTTTMQELKPSPTLNTVAMVEAAIKAGSARGMSVADIKRSLPRKVNHYTLKAVLEYLERERKISVALTGIKWNGEQKSQI